MTSYNRPPSTGGQLQRLVVRVALALAWLQRLGRPLKRRTPDTPAELLRIWTRRRRGLSPGRQGAEH